MSLRSSGFWCDVCNKPMVSEMFLNKPIPSFKVTCSPDQMHNHKECEKLITQSVASMDETILPAGSPLGDLLKRVKEHNAKFEENHESVAKADE